MWILSIPVQHSFCRYYRPCTYTQHHCNLSNLIYPTRFIHTPNTLSQGACGTVSQLLQEFISGYISLRSLDFLALPETWITSENPCSPLVTLLLHPHTQTHQQRGWYCFIDLLQLSSLTFSLTASTLHSLFF